MKWLFHTVFVLHFFLGFGSLQQRSIVTDSRRGGRFSAGKSKVNDFNCPEDFGYYPHLSDCSQYYVCVFGGALLESCTGGLLYSKELQTCDWPRNVPCGATKNDGGISTVIITDPRTRSTVPVKPVTESLTSVFGLDSRFDNSVQPQFAPVIQRRGSRDFSNQFSLNDQDQLFGSHFQVQESTSQSFSVSPSNDNFSSVKEDFNFIRKRRQVNFDYDYRDILFPPPSAAHPLSLHHSQYSKNPFTRNQYQRLPPTSLHTRPLHRQPFFSDSKSPSSHLSFSPPGSVPIPFRPSARIPPISQERPHFNVPRPYQNTSHLVFGHSNKYEHFPGYSEYDGYSQTFRDKGRPPNPYGSRPTNTKDFDDPWGNYKHGSLEESHVLEGHLVTRPLKATLYNPLGLHTDEEDSKISYSPQPVTYRPGYSSFQPPMKDLINNNEDEKQLADNGYNETPAERPMNEELNSPSQQKPPAPSNILRKNLYSSSNRPSTNDVPTRGGIRVKAPNKSKGQEAEPLFNKPYSNKRLRERHKDPKISHSSETGQHLPKFSQLPIKTSKYPDKSNTRPIQPLNYRPDVKPVGPFTSAHSFGGSSSTHRPAAAVFSSFYSDAPNATDDYYYYYEYYDDYYDSVSTTPKPSSAPTTKKSAPSFTEKPSPVNLFPRFPKLFPPTAATASPPTSVTHNTLTSTTSRKSTAIKPPKLVPVRVKSPVVVKAFGDRKTESSSVSLPSSISSSSSSSFFRSDIKTSKKPTDSPRDFSRINSNGKGTSSKSGGKTAIPTVVDTTSSQRIRHPSLVKPKPVSDILSSDASSNNIWNHPPKRPKTLYPQPPVDQKAARCDSNTCRLPDCSCGGKEVPGGIPPEQVPQIVLMTFDDSVNDLNKNLYIDLFERGRTNPNGCPISATFYISHEWTDYSQVQNLYSDGHEIASHSITHSFGEQFSTAKWAKEIAGQSEILAAYGGVKMEDIRGMRAPFLAIGGNNMFRMLHDQNFTYDSSMPVYENKPPSWPYTLDYKIFHECMIPPCPTNSYPGVWEVPMVMWQDLNGGRCSMGDGCTAPADAESVYRMLIKNFERHYTTNRAPFGLFYHAAWFTHAHHKEGFVAFLDTITAMDDVWIITNWQALQWVRDPVPLSQIHNYEPWKCHYPDRPKRCKSHKTCNVWHKGSLRYMRTCQECPSVYPWVGNTGVASPLNDV